MRGRMAIDFEGLRILRRQDLQRGIGFERTVQIQRLPLTLATRASSAKRGLMERATSMGAAPAEYFGHFRPEG